MKPATLKKKLDLHNKIKTGLTIAFVLFAIVLFVISFFAANLVSWFILVNLIQDAEFYSFWIAVVFVVVLLVEGLRSAKYMMEQQSADESLGTINDIVSGSHFYYERGWLYATHFFSHFLFAAPYAIIRAMEESKKIVKADDSAITQASNAWNILKQNPKKWTPVSQLSQYGPGLIVLYKMELIWIESEENGCACRIADN